MEVCYEILDYYKILEVNPNVSREEIKKSYRLLAMMYHPDRYGDIGNEELYQKAEEKFKLIQMAYRTLSDPEKRAEYDAHYSEIKRRQRYTEYRTERDAEKTYEEDMEYDTGYERYEEPTQESAQKDVPETPTKSTFPTKTLYFSLASLLAVLLGFLCLSFGEAFAGWGIFQIATGIAGMGIGGWRLWSHDTTGSKITGALFLAPTVIIIGYVALAFLIIILVICGLFAALGAGGGDC